MTMTFKKLIDLMAHAGVVFFTCGWLMVLLVLGTVAQRYVGLYAAQNTFFYSIILWVGPVPLPGGMTTMVLLTLGLAVKLFFRSDANIKRAGAIIAHIGALLLMVGGLITYLYAVEGSMTLFPQEKANAFTAYHDREWVAVDDEDGRVLARIPFQDIKNGTVLAIPETDVTATIVRACRNCTFTPRDPQAIDPDLRGRARNFDMTPAPLAKMDEENQAAVLFRVAGTNTDKDGIHLSADFISVAPWIDISDKRITLALRKTSYPLPFSVELSAFRRSVHPGTDMAQSYESDIIIHENGTSWPATIRMNAPFRYRGYTFYQSSFLQDGTREGTVLAVVRNDARAYPYIASLIMSLGILIHLIKRLTKKQRPIDPAVRAAGIVLLLTVSVALAPAARASDQVPLLSNPALSTLGALPIQDQGRIKPLDTFARSMLERFSGRDHTDRESAIMWLTRVLFAPDSTQNDPVFRIANESVRDMLRLSPQPGHRYDVGTVIAALAQTRDVWTPLTTRAMDDLSLPQKQVLELAENVDDYMDLVGTFARVRPRFVIDDTALAKKLDVPIGSVLSANDLRAHRAFLLQAMTALNKKAARQKPTDKMTPYEIALVDMVTGMSTIDRTPPSKIFRVIPGNPIFSTIGPVPASPLEKEWAGLALGITENNSNQINLALTAMTQQTQNVVPHTAFAVEHILNHYAPITISLVLYLLVLGLLVVRTFFAHPLPFFGSALSVLISSAVILHLFGVIARMVILGRPPVTNLYDSILFVGIVGVAGLCAMAIFKRDFLYAILAALTGILLQSISLKFDAEGDTLRVLSAVLDTNFWLATHVVVITIGYATAIMTALVAHTALIQRITHPRDTTRASGLYRTANTLSFVALFTTTVGTILGGIWADQSWGRFWGWDPKENGALLIVLWLIWVLHGRIGGFLRERATLALLTALNIIVALSWFGVNLLGVGLHSYGFTESATWGLTAFCVIEGAIILALTWGAGVRARIVS